MRALLTLAAILLAAPTVTADDPAVDCAPGDTCKVCLGDVPPPWLSGCAEIELTRVVDPVPPPCTCDPVT